MRTETGKVPVTVMTGFLGAGKTTLIRNLLQSAHGRRIALIVNEFGDVGVDGELLRGCGGELYSDEDIVELSNGCLCCTVADDFVPTMIKLLEKAEPPEHIVIETSGLALPQPLIRAFNWPEVRTRVTVAGVVTVVDSAAVAEGRFASDESAVDQQREADEALVHESPLEQLFEDQLACADMVILNKADLVCDAKLDEIEGVLKGHVRQGVSFLRALEGNVPSTVLLGLAAAAENDMETRNSHHEQEGGEDHDHDDFETFVVDRGAVQNREGILKAIADTIARHDILRIKGFLSVDGAESRLVIQAVGPRLVSYFDRPWGAGEAQSSSLVVIGEKGLDQTRIREALAR